MANRYSSADSMKMDGKPAMSADVLHIDFQTKRFNRKVDAQVDPPPELIEEIANDFLARLRYVTNASKIKLIKLSNLNWSCTYLKDDGTELRKNKRYICGRGVRKFVFSYVALDKQIWEDIHSIPPGYEFPVWKTLLLDAASILPETGPAIILTFTALEVFISKILDSVAKYNKIDRDFWGWVNSRGYLKEPSIEEKYNFLSLHIIGKSIKENNDLWEAFKHLRKARNSFAHTGVAMIGDELVTEEKTRFFIRKAKEIIDFIKKEIPEELRWLEFKHGVQMEIIQALRQSMEEEQ